MRSFVNDAYSSFSIEQKNKLSLNNYTGLFQECVFTWLSLCECKYGSWINNIIREDNRECMIELSEGSKYSSAVVILFKLVYSLSDLWKELDWPKLSDCPFSFKLARIVCDCVVSYAVQLKLETEAKNFYAADGFDVEKKLCVVFNNIEEIKNRLNEMKPEFLDSINVREIFTAAQYHISEILVNCIRNFIFKITPIITGMASNECKALLASEKLKKRSVSDEKISDYIKRNLDKLNICTFESIRNTFICHLWDVITRSVSIFLDTIHNTSHFNIFESYIECLFKFVRNIDHEHSTTSRFEFAIEYKNLIEWFSLSKLSSDTLIVNYLNGVLRTAPIQDDVFGSVTVSVRIIQIDTENFCVHIDQLKAKNLDGKISAGTSDPYAVLNLFPNVNVLCVSTLKTAVQKKTLNPEWKNLGEYKIRDANIHKYNIMVQFFDWNLFAKHTILAECLIPLSFFSKSGGLHTLYLGKTLPGSNVHILKLLTCRKDCPIATDFIAKRLG